MLLGKVETTLRVAASAAIQAAQQQASEAAAGGPFPQQAAEQAVASQVAAIEAELQGALDGLRSTFQQARAEDVPGEIPDCYLVRTRPELHAMRRGRSDGRESAVRRWKQGEPSLDVTHSLAPSVGKRKMRPA
jgi:hypothetical protein